MLKEDVKKREQKFSLFELMLLKIVNKAGIKKQNKTKKT